MLKLIKRIKNLWRLSELELPIVDGSKIDQPVIQLMKPKKMARVIKYYKKDPLDEFIEQ